MAANKGFTGKYGVTLITMNAFLRSVKLVNARGKINSRIDQAFAIYGQARPSGTNLQAWCISHQALIKQKGANFKSGNAQWKAAPATVETSATVDPVMRKAKQPPPPNFQKPAIDPNGPDFINSYAWRALRMKVLVKYGRVCMCCGATPDNSTEIMNVDHIKPRRNRPDLALDFNNLQVLCGTCNHGKSSWDETDWRPVAEPVAEEHRAQVAHLRSI